MLSGLSVGCADDGTERGVEIEGQTLPYVVRQFLEGVPCSATMHSLPGSCKGKGLRRPAQVATDKPIAVFRGHSLSQVLVNHRSGMGWLRHDRCLTPRFCAPHGFLSRCAVVQSQRYPLERTSAVAAVRVSNEVVCGAGLGHVAESRAVERERRLGQSERVVTVTPHQRGGDGRQLRAAGADGKPREAGRRRGGADVATTLQCPLIC